MIFTAYIPSHPNQNYLLPPKITDLFPKDHVCYLIEQIANELDYSEFDKQYEGAGHPAYHPRINIKLLLMAYVDSIRSSRKIAKNSHENVVYIYLAEKTSPDFRTISDFRKDNKELIANVFKQVNEFAVKHDLIDLSHLMTDGTIIEANANNYKLFDKQTLEKLNKYVDKVIEEGIKVDEEEDKTYGERGMHELPEDLNDKEKRNPIVHKIVDEINKSMKQGNTKEAKQTIDNLNKKIGEAKQISLTDPDSRRMRNKKNRVEPSYNAQLVAGNNGFIVANRIVQACDDRNQLLPNIEQVEQNFGPLAEGTKISADAGYEKANVLEGLDNKGFDLYVPGKNVSNTEKKFAKANFKYDEEQDAYICPENKLLRNVGDYFNKKRNEYLTIYKTCAEDCFNCPYLQECCKTGKNRAIHALPQDKLLNQIKVKLRSEEGMKIYQHRKETVEKSFGDIKHNKGFRRFLLRGLNKVQIEWNLVCTAHNLVMINNLIRKKGNVAC